MTSIPSGFELFGWHWFEGIATDALARDSAVHLIGFEEVVYGASDPNTPSKVNIALCGQAPRGRGRVVDAPDELRNELDNGNRMPCSGCLRKATDDTKPTGQRFGSQRGGMGLFYDYDYARSRSTGRAAVTPKDAA